MFETVFYNYQNIKLYIQHPNISNALFFFIVLCIALISLKQSTASSDFLNKIETDQVRGIAIIFVIIGHFCFHVSKIKADLIFSGDAVAIFFLLSGYGLTISYKRKTQSLTYYIARRIKRVLVPYWLATLLLLSLDYVFLHKLYHADIILLTFSGINVSEATWYIDYTRWYITLLLLWYGLFLCSVSALSGSRRIVFLFCCATFIFIVDHYLLHYHWFQIFSFPAGCAMGEYYDDIKSIFFKRKRWFAGIALLVLFYIVLYKLYLISFTEKHIPYIVFKCGNEINSILLTAALLIISGYAGFKHYVSYFLYFCGTISYELFLIHGAFLIKYNPIIKHTDLPTLAIEFSLFLLFILILSWLFHKLVMGLVSFRLFR